MDLAPFEDAVTLYDIRCPLAGRKGIESGFRSPPVESDPRDLKTSILHFPERWAGRTPPICPELGRWMDRSHAGEQGRREKRIRRRGREREADKGREGKDRSSPQGRGVDCKFARWFVHGVVSFIPVYMHRKDRVKGEKERERTG